MDALKITAKMDIPEAVVKKHLKVLKKKYCWFNWYQKIKTLLHTNLWI
jgi:hypothetical protein